MDKFFTILAWFVAIPSSFLVLIMALQVLIVLITPDTKVTIKWTAIIPWILAGCSWAWIFH